MTALLEDLRALILKSRPAYRDFLGEVTEAKTIKILENVVLSENWLMLPAADAAFSGFVSGKTYRVILNGEEESVVAKYFDGAWALSNVEDFSNPPNDAWVLAYNSEKEKMFAMARGAFLGATISVYYDETVTTQRWSVKKLAYELLPDQLLSALSAAANTARKALIAANAAQSTANAAQSTADNALPKAGGNIEGSVDVSGNLSAGEVIVRASGNELVYTVLSCKNEEVGEVSHIGFARSGGVALVSIGNTGYTADTIKSAQVSLDLGKNKGITFSHDGNAYHMRCGGPLDLSTGDSVNGWNPIQVQGISGIIMKSSKSNKKFKITVDDAGTLSATEVTNTTT